MVSNIKRLTIPLRLTAVALTTFFLFSTVSSVFAQVSIFGPCVTLGGTLEGETNIVLSQMKSQTRQSSSGCTRLTAYFRRWSGVTYTQVGGDGANHAQAYTDWFTLTHVAGSSNTAQHRGYRDVQYWITYTSSNGLYSTAQWFCLGTSTGSGANCNP